VVGLGEDGRVAWTLSGTCTEPFASSFRAEQTALLEALRIAVPPIKIHCDNQQVVDGVASGRSWCTDARREGADLWKAIWDALDDVGEGVNVVKVKAHTSWREVARGIITLRDQRGNAMADAAAKAALASLLRAAPTDSFDTSLARALSWLKWVLKYAETWGTRVDTEAATAEDSVEAATASAPPPPYCTAGA
jgi:ribonuclease HI